VVAKNYSKIFDPYYNGSMLDSEEEWIDKVWDIYIKDYSGRPNETQFINDVFRPLFDSRINLSDPRDINHLIAIYDAKILRTDEFIGLFLKKLENLGILNNTIIVILSDHGEEFFEHGKAGHAQ